MMKYDKAAALIANNYMDVANLVYTSILSGEYLPGQRLPSLRSLATIYGVSVATVARGVTEVERKGLIITERSRGKRVIDDSMEIQKIKTHLVSEQTASLKDKLNALGYSDYEIIELVSKVLTQTGVD